jgi:hypothetical protein
MADRNLDEELKYFENMSCEEVMAGIMLEMRGASSTIAGTTQLLQDYFNGEIDNIEELGKILDYQKNAVDKMTFLHQLYFAYRDKRFSDDSNQEVD